MLSSVLVSVTQRNRQACFMATFSVLVTAGCATPYQAMRWTGGYDDFRIAEDLFEVTFKGNAYTSRETVSRYVLRRASEVTLSNGFTHFVPVREMDRTKYGAVYRGSSHMTARMHGRTAYGRGSTHGYSSQIEKPGTTMRIFCFKKPLPDEPGIIDARRFLEFNFPEPLQSSE